MWKSHLSGNSGVAHEATNTLTASDSEAAFPAASLLRPCPLLRNAIVFLLLMLFGCSSHAPKNNARVVTDAASHAAPSIGAQRTSWPMYQGGPTHNAVFPGEQPDASWTVQFRDKINAGLAVDGDRVYTDSFDHNVYALDLRSGRLLWSTSTNNVVMSTPVIQDGIVIVGTGKDGWLNPGADNPAVQIWGRPQGDNVYALSASTGKVLWRFHTVGDDMASAAIDGDTVVFANGDLHAYGLDLHRGTLRWQIPILGVASMDSTTIDRGLAFISSCRIGPRRCETIAVNVENGNVRWRSDVGSADASPAVARGVVVTNMLDLDESGKYDQGGRSIIAGLDELTGRTIWKWKSDKGPCTFVGSGEHEIAPLMDNTLVIDSVGCGSEIVAIDAHSGKLRWKFRAYAHVKMSAIAYRDHVFFGDTNGVFYDVDERNGFANRFVSFDQLFTAAPFVIVGKSLLAACGSEIYAVPLRHGFSPLAIPVHDIWKDRPVVNAVR